MEALDDLAEKLLQAVETGEISALKEFGDRLDGKPSQAVTVAGDPDNPTPIESKVIVEIVRAGPDTGSA